MHNPVYHEASRFFVAIRKEDAEEGKYKKKHYLSRKWLCPGCPGSLIEECIEKGGYDQRFPQTVHGAVECVEEIAPEEEFHGECMKECEGKQL